MLHVEIGAVATALRLCHSGDGAVDFTYGNGGRRQPDDAACRQGLLLLAVGRLFEKGLRLGTGQANVKRYNRQLRDMITDGRARPSFVVSHELPLEDAPAAYQKFDQRVEGYTKVILRPETNWR